VKRKKVKSSNITSVGYNQKTHELEIEFTTGAIYKYENVPFMVYMDLLDAKSIGLFFAQFIKYNYKYARM